MTCTSYAYPMASNPYGSNDNVAGSSGAGATVGPSSAQISSLSGSTIAGSKLVDYGVASSHHHQQYTQMPHNSSISSSNNNNNNSNNRTQHQPMSKTHAHSTSLLANDSYLSGMSSDSELTSNSARHNRPYSSQSRVYHAHPAPHRNTHASSRMSHYSDSAAGALSFTQNDPQQHRGSSGISCGVMQQQPVASSPQPIAGSHHQQQLMSHQGSVSSSESACSVSSNAYYSGLTPNEMSLSQAGGNILHQQQQTPMSSLSRQVSGRQLPSTTGQRPFKQSMSIDHHSIGHQYHQKSHHPISHINSQTHIMSPHYTDQTADFQQSANNYPVTSAILNNQQPTASQVDMRYGSLRNYRLEMDMIEKQAANMKLYDKEHQQQILTTGLPPTSTRPSSSHRQLPSINSTINNSSSMSVDHLHNPPQALDQYHTPEHELQKSSHHQQHQQDLYPAGHLISGGGADWLPPMGLSGHHLNRATTSVGPQFKQTMSIDQYPIAQANQQLQYSPSRMHHLSDHFRNSVGYMTNSPVSYDSPTHQVSQSGAYNSGQMVNTSAEMIYQPYFQDQQQQSPLSHSSNHQDLYGNQASELVNQQNMASSGKYAKSSSSGLSQQQLQKRQNEVSASSSVVGAPHQRHNLRHQVSSSSSNSQSGSLRSSNVDLNKSSMSDHHQKSISMSHNIQQSPQHKNDYEHKQHGVLRKGYTSATPDGVGSGAIYNDDSLSSQSAAPHSSAAHSISHSKRAGMRVASPSVALEATTSTGSGQHYHHSSVSSREAGGNSTRSESSTGLRNEPGSTSSLTKKSNSATQLSMSGTKKRLGFRKKQVTSFSVHRSEEVAPFEARHLVKQGSSVSEGDSSMSGDSSSRSWSNTNYKPQTEEITSMSFIEGLGKGQMISRQGLASPYLGDIQLSLCDRRGNLEIEVIRARKLQAKTNKILPLTYVKLYLVKNRKCLAKAKTTLSNKRTLEPLFQQQLTFHEDYRGCILQSIVWGNFGKMDKKNFMGIAQISIDDLELSDTVISWYRLFLPSSLQTLPSKSLRHTLLSNSTESFTNTNNS